MLLPELSWAEGETVGPHWAPIGPWLARVLEHPVPVRATAAASQHVQLNAQGPWGGQALFPAASADHRGWEATLAPPSHLGDAADLPVPASLLPRPLVSSWGCQLGKSWAI